MFRMFNLALLMIIPFVIPCFKNKDAFLGTTSDKSEKLKKLLEIIQILSKKENLKTKKTNNISGKAG